MKHKFQKGFTPWNKGKIGVTCGPKKGNTPWNKQEGILKYCQQCNKEFRVPFSLVRLKFCSQQCYWENIKGKPNGRKEKRFKITCKYCKKELLVTKWYLKNKKFCSRKCKDLFLIGITFSPKTTFKKGHTFWLGKRRLNVSGEKNHNWNNGSSFEPYPLTFNQQLKDKIRVRDNFKCQLCGVPELESIKRLHIHHIDFNKENCNEDNLIALCNNCHTKTNSNREKWIIFFKNRFNGYSYISQGGF